MQHSNPVATCQVLSSMSYMLDKSQVENLVPLEYEYLNLMLLNLGPKYVLIILSIHVSLRTTNGVPLAR
jgi:hypothetical protein